MKASQIKPTYQSINRMKVKLVKLRWNFQIVVYNVLKGFPKSVTCGCGDDSSHSYWAPKWVKFTFLHLIFGISCCVSYRVSFLTGTPQFQYQKENRQAANHSTGFTGTAAVIGWFAVFFLVLKLRMLSPSLCIQWSQCDCSYCCSQLSEM